MKTTVIIADPLFDELLHLTGAGSRAEAVQVAVEAYVRRTKLERLRELRGRLDIGGTEAADEADTLEQRASSGP